jgi:hypothetical protein
VKYSGAIARERARSIQQDWPRLVRHVLCVLALMWTGLVNGQAFFFPSDSTNYVRAADMAVYLASGKTLSTEWTARHRASVAGGPRVVAGPATSVNSLGSGQVMRGRSPYIGALMYLGYVTSDFWAFVAMQALIAYGLIILALRTAGVTSAKAVVGVVALLAGTTALPTYNSTLLADAFSAFGIVAFVLLASPARFSRWELAFLYVVLAVFGVSHMTHAWMMTGMVAVLAFSRWRRWIAPVPKRAWIAGAATIAAGILSVQVTSYVVQLAFGRGTQLLPLLTARVIADGPGKAFIDSGCDGRRFQICRVHIGEPSSDPAILFGLEQSTGAYMLATLQERRRMSEEDLAFAFAVLRSDPFGQIAMSLRNSLRQLLWIDYDGLNQGCWEKADCWDSLPPRELAKLKTTPSGRNAWPQEAMNVLLYAVVILSLATIPFAYRRIKRVAPERAATVRMWMLVGFAGMLVSCVLGGAVADPQYRYQGRLIWMVPFLAAILVLMVTGRRRTTGEAKIDLERS